MIYANFKNTSKSIYILCIYIENVMKCAKWSKYPMGILWVCYGYPMVKSGGWQVVGELLSGRRQENILILRKRIFLLLKISFPLAYIRKKQYFCSVVDDMTL